MPIAYRLEMILTAWISHLAHTFLLNHVSAADRN